jgi:hypothetical protein
MKVMIIGYTVGVTLKEDIYLILRLWKVGVDIGAKIRR